MNIKACIFDLDGVITDTAHHHYLSWQRIAQMIGSDLSLEQNEFLKGVNRAESLEKILEWSDIQLDESRKTELLIAKNELYLGRINDLSPKDILPGVKEFLTNLKEQNISIAIGSSSKNAPVILQRLGLLDWFNAISDGNSVAQTKPDPAVFLYAARCMQIDPKYCVVFEDAVSGVNAAIAAGMKVIGVGDASLLPKADAYISTMKGLNLEGLKELIA